MCTDAYAICRTDTCQCTLTSCSVDSTKFDTKLDTVLTGARQLTGTLVLNAGTLGLDETRLPIRLTR
jgi:hypothetical protein